MARLYLIYILYPGLKYLSNNEKVRLPVNLWCLLKTGLKHNAKLHSPWAAYFLWYSDFISFSAIRAILIPVSCSHFKLNSDCFHILFFNRNCHSLFTFLSVEKLIILLIHQCISIIFVFSSWVFVSLNDKELVRLFRVHVLLIENTL